MVKDLSLLARLRTSGKTIFKEIGTREKEAKKKATVFWFTWMWCCGSRGGTVFWSSLQTRDRPGETPGATGWRWSCKIARNETMWRLLKVNQNLTKAKNVSDAARDWGCWESSLQEGQAVPTVVSQKFCLYKHSYWRDVIKNCIRRKD